MQSCSFASMSLATPSSMKTYKVLSFCIERMVCSLLSRPTAGAFPT